MPDQVPAVTKARRNRILRQLGEQKFLAFKQSVVGQTLPVVVLGERDCETGLLHGVSDNYLGILFGGPDGLRGRLVDVRVEGMGGRGMLSGRVLAGGAAPQPPLQRPLPLVAGC